MGKWRKLLILMRKIGECCSIGTIGRIGIWVRYWRRRLEIILWRKLGNRPKIMGNHAWLGDNSLIPISLVCCRVFLSFVISDLKILFIVHHQQNYRINILVVNSYVGKIDYELIINIINHKFALKYLIHPNSFSKKIPHYKI